MSFLERLLNLRCTRSWPPHHVSSSTSRSWSLPPPFVQAP